MRRRQGPERAARFRAMAEARLPAVAAQRRAQEAPRRAVPEAVHRVPEARRVATEARTGVTAARAAATAESPMEEPARRRPGHASRRFNSAVRTRRQTASTNICRPRTTE